MKANSLQCCLLQTGICLMIGFGQIIGLFDEQELNENYIVLTDSPFKLKFEDILKKISF